MHQTPHSPKNKRRVNTTPPPSRRPVGPPNSPQPPKPPPSSIQQPDVVHLDPPHPKQHHENCINGKTPNSRRTDSLTDNLVINDGHLSTINNSVGNQDSSGMKNTIDEQLKRLIHRNRKTTHSDKTNSVGDNHSTMSPILSILQTSIENMDDKDNEELTRINDHEITSSPHDATKFLNSSSSPVLSPFRNKVIGSPSPARNYVRSPSDIEARLELQSTNSCRVRMEVWKAIRNRTGKI